MKKTVITLGSLIFVILTKISEPVSKFSSFGIGKLIFIACSINILLVFFYILIKINFPFSKNDILEANGKN